MTPTRLGAPRYPITFKTVTVRVPSSDVVRIPDGYAHEFASMPVRWREVFVDSSKYLDFPALDPASEKALRGDRWYLAR